MLATAIPRWVLMRGADAAHSDMLTGDDTTAGGGSECAVIATLLVIWLSHVPATCCIITSRFRPW